MSSSLLFIILIGLLGGLMAGFQAPVANWVGQKMGPMEGSIALHLGGAMVSVCLWVFGFRAAGRPELNSLMIVGAVVGGGLGALVLSTITYTFPRIGAAAGLTLVVAMQLIVAAGLDHFGFLGDIRPFGATRLLGMLLLLPGIWLMVR